MTIAASRTGTQQAATAPSEPVGVRVKGTFTGIDLAWSLPVDEGGTADGEGPASPATAAAPTTDAVTVTHTVTADGITRTFLGQAASQGATQVIPLAVSGPTQQVDPAIAASADGTKVVFSQGQTSLWTVSAVVPNAQPVKILDGSSGITAKSWSPDGTRIAFERQQGGSSCVEIIGATGGIPVRVGCDLAGPAWLPDSQTLVVKDQVLGKLQRVQAKASGVILGSYAGTEAARNAAVSPNGRWIGYLQGTAAAVIPVAGGTPVVGESAGTSAESLSWAGSTQLLVVRRTAAGSALAVVPVMDGRPRTSAKFFDPPVGELLGAAVWQGRGITIPPTATVIGPSVSIPFDTTGLVSPYVSCEFDGVTTAPCVSPFKQSGVAAGTHLLRVWAVEPGGRGTEAVRQLTVDTTAAVVQFTGAAYDVTKAATATLTYAGTDTAGIGSYDVRWRIAPTAGNFGAYALVASATTATSVRIGVVAGYEYCVGVRARDIAGNLSGWTADRCFSRPSDDRAMGAATGWVRAVHQSYYLGTATATGVQGISVSRSVQAKRLFLVATKCATCGSLNVYYNGKYVGVVNLYKATTEYQAIVAMPVPATFLTGSVVLTTRVAGKVNQIDGLAVRRT